MEFSARPGLRAVKSRRLAIRPNSPAPKVDARRGANSRFATIAACQVDLFHRHRSTQAESAIQPQGQHRAPDQYGAGEPLPPLPRVPSPGATLPVARLGDADKHGAAATTELSELNQGGHL
jgi:hypothetical protein